MNVISAPAELPVTQPPASSRRSVSHNTHCQPVAERGKLLARKLWKRTPLACALVVLVCQLALPWSTRSFVTTDGPAHLYGAIVARDLMLHGQHGAYGSIYAIGHGLLPNWMTTVVLGLLAGISGTGHAEQLFASLAMLLGIFGLNYLSRSLAPEQNPWTPLMSFVVQSWFLWIGFYNFYLGMILVPFLVGFHVRNRGRLNLRRAMIIAGALVGLYFTHLVAVALAVVALFAVTFWELMFGGESQGGRAHTLRQAGILGMAALPGIFLVLQYLHGSPPAAHLLEIAGKWRDFPEYVFFTGQGTAGQQVYMQALALVYFGVSLLVMRGREWRSPRGALAMVALIAFAIYLFVPDEGLGGSVVKIRFAWAVFLFICPISCSVRDMRRLSAPCAIAVSILMIQNFIATRQESQRLSSAVEPYEAASNWIPRGASIIRLNYPAPKAAALYGFDDRMRYPYLHLDSSAAVRDGGVDLTDYEALTELFPVILKANIRDKRKLLWAFERADRRDEEILDSIRVTIPRPVDVVLLFGDETSPEAIQRGMPRMSAYLKSSMTLLSTSSDRLLRIYGRK